MRADALHVAIKKKDEQLIRQLLQHDVLKNSYIDGDTPLLLAVKQGSVSIVELLIEHGVDVICHDKPDYRTPLHLAVRSEIPEMISIFIQYFIELDTKDIYGDTALHYTVNLSHEMNNNDILVKSFIDRGADVNAANGQGDTPLHCAAENNHLATMQLLIDRGADVNASRSRELYFPGDTPLHYAVTHNHANAMEILIRAGAIIDFVGNYHMTPLHWACRRINHYIVRFLILKGCDLDTRDYLGDTALEEVLDFHEGPDRTEMVATITGAIRELAVNRNFAVMMGQHPRLGKRSLLRFVPTDVIRTKKLNK